MAVVALPFTTCFTSEDINSFQAYAVRAQSDDVQEHLSRTGVGNSTSLGANSIGSSSKTASSDPSGESGPRTDSNWVDTRFEAVSHEGHHVDNDGENDMDTLHNELTTQPTTPTSDEDKDVVDTLHQETETQLTAPTSDEDKVVMDALHQDLETQLTTATGNEDGNDEGDWDKEMDALHQELQAQLATPEAAEDDASEMQTTEAFRSEVEMYGGLKNLGNTCYMNSALQAIASLDGFTEALATTPLPGANDNYVDGTDSDVSNINLRKAFLDVMSSLEKGETVSPTEFKLALDERTPLFLGYHQEDAHEFLTTLFDLLDADYEVKEQTTTKEEEKQKFTCDESMNWRCEECTENKDNPITSQQSTLQNSTEPQSDKVGEDVVTTTSAIHCCDTEAFESALKKPRNELSGQADQENINSVRQARLGGVYQSFSELQPEGIEELLNARLLVNSTQDLVTTPSPPKCKLAGGRMAASETNGTVLFCDSDASILSPAPDTPRQEQDGTGCKTLSPVESYLQTEVRVRLTCESCKYSRTHLENFLHLSLEIGAENDDVSSNVVDGLRKFFAPEKREIKCEKCFHESALQTMAITRLPKALLLHFKRFIVDISEDFTSIKYRKNQSEVLFDPTLDFGVLSEFVADDFSLPDGCVDSTGNGEAHHSYNIRSVVNHMGASAACGHYTADALRAYPSGERRWNRFNDSFVTDISSGKAIRDSTRTAYMVMYELLSDL